MRRKARGWRLVAVGDIGVVVSPPYASSCLAVVLPARCDRTCVRHVFKLHRFGHSTARATVELRWSGAHRCTRLHFQALLLNPQVVLSTDGRGRFAWFPGEPWGASTLWLATWPVRCPVGCTECGPCRDLGNEFHENNNVV
jgi:hypothetical protein